jgi:hypothetical protein
MACWQIAKGKSDPVPADTSVDGSATPPSASQAAATNARSKATPDRLKAVVTDIGRGLTREQACARNHCSHDTWQNWEKLPEFPTLRDEALAARLDYLLNAMEEAQRNKLDWRMFAWQAERVKAFREQFADPSKVSVQFNTQINNHNHLHSNQNELEEARKRLDETKRLQLNRKAGVATNAELRETMIRQIEECQHVVDCIDRGETPSQETQQQLYRLHEEGGERWEEQPVREAIGHVVGKPLALEGGPEPALPTPQDMRASDMDPLSGQPVTESEHVRQADKKQMAGPLSERQRQRLEWEKARRGGEGKGIF